MAVLAAAFSFVVVLASQLTRVAAAGPTILYSVSFSNCARDIAQSNSAAPNYDLDTHCKPETGSADPTWYGSWGMNMGPSGTGSQITTLADHTGNGGRGFRGYRTDGFDVNSGGLGLKFPQTTDFWIRWYMRYAKGFGWNPSGSPAFTKDLYMIGNTATNWTWGFHGSDSLWGWTAAGTTDETGQHGWRTIMGGATADGQFHCYEYHTKIGNSTTTGVKQMWVDGVQVMDLHNVSLGTSGTWGELTVFDNSNNPYVDLIAPYSQGAPVDFDDIVIATGSGPIGCMATPSPAPSAPQNVRIQR
jgi:hypothetical protein